MAVLGADAIPGPPSAAVQSTGPCQLPAAYQASVSPPPGPFQKIICCDPFGITVALGDDCSGDPPPKNALLRSSGPCQAPPAYQASSASLFRPCQNTACVESSGVTMALGADCRGAPPANALLV